MTQQALQQAIARLIIKRREAHGNSAEQDRLNEKLTKLYNLQWVMLTQLANGTYKEI